jgi:hypothetical protein
MPWNDPMPRSPALRTNRDLYRFVTSLHSSNTSSERSLEDYLRTLWRLGSAHRELAALPLDELAGILEAALREPPPAFDPCWPASYTDDTDELAGFERWEATIRAQIVDLHEMDQAGLARPGLSRRPSRSRESAGAAASRHLRK